MNIFAVDRDPRRAARALHDVHVVSQIGETHQIMSDALARLQIRVSIARRPYNPHGRFAKWTASSSGNVLWLMRHGATLCNEHVLRFGTHHASQNALGMLGDLLLTSVREGRRKPFAMDKRTEFIASECGLDPVAAYREYYHEKLMPRDRPATWTGTHPPGWLTLIWSPHTTP